MNNFVILAITVFAWEMNTGKSASPISAAAIKVALKVLDQLNKADIFSTGIEVNVFPMRDGGIQFEFDADDLCAELKIDEDGQMLSIQFNEEANVVRKIVIHQYELPELSSLPENARYAGLSFKTA